VYTFELGFSRFYIPTGARGDLIPRAPGGYSKFDISGLQNYFVQISKINFLSGHKAVTCAITAPDFYRTCTKDYFARQFTAVTEILRA